MNDQILTRLSPPLGTRTNNRSLLANNRHDKSFKKHIAIIGTFAPRKCGIATFTKDIVDKLAQFHPDISIDIYALDDRANRHVYEGIVGLIDVTDRAASLKVANDINSSGVDAVWIQHEYGIYGGNDGDLICGLVDRLAAPIILTPHTVLGEPSSSQERILRHLVERASQIMVMSRHSRELLATRYGASHATLEVIEHGAPDRPFGRQDQFKHLLGLAGRPVLTTFGLIGPGKGLEAMIAAMPASSRARHPDTVYRIVGATHPNLVAVMARPTAMGWWRWPRTLG